VLPAADDPRASCSSPTSSPSRQQLLASTPSLDRLERVTFVVRGAVVLCAFVVFLSAPSLVTYPLLFWPALGVAAIYTVAAILASGRLSLRALQVVLTCCDAGLTLLLFAATGGTSSLPVAILFLVAVTVAHRFGLVAGAVPMVAIIAGFTVVALTSPSPLGHSIAPRSLTITWWDLYFAMAFVLAGTLTAMAREELSIRMRLEARAADAAFSRSMERLAASERSDTIRGILHDLTSPLSSIISLSQHLEGLFERSSTTSDPEVRTAHLLHENATYLADICDALRRSVQGPDPLAAFAPAGTRTVALRPLMEAAIEAALTTSPITLSVTPADALVVLDPTIVNRLVRNLVENAVRYNPPHAPPVRVKVIVTRSTMRVMVHDNGPGLRPDEEQLAIRKGTRLHDDPNGGQGLGLWIVDQLVRNCGGTFSLFTPPGGGLCAAFEIPIGRPDV
jgi:signal transduction histidine kinase